VYQIFKAEVQGEMQKLIPISVTTAASEIGGTIYLPSTRTTNIELRGEESKVVVGRVVDRMHNDAPIGGASVSITDPSGETRSMTTEADGRFRLTIPIGNDSYPTLQGSASAKGFEPGSFSATTDGKSYIVRLTPLEATLVGHIINEETGIGIDGSTVHVTAPFDQVLTTSGGDFTLTGLYVGETITMRADAQNFRAYVKSGKLTLANASVTFSLKPSDVEGSEEGGGLDAEEADEEDKKQVADLSKLYSLMVWATPADPGTFQDVTITAQIFPPTQGVVIEVQMHGTDDYAASNTGTTNAMGKVFLSIPGAASGIVDDVVAWIVGTSVKQRLRYSF